MEKKRKRNAALFSNYSITSYAVSSVLDYSRRSRRFLNKSRMEAKRVKVRKVLKAKRVKVRKELMEKLMVAVLEARKQSGPKRKERKVESD